jgi:predicted negative regulator of RcsB-dependent stress response
MKEKLIDGLFIFIIVSILGIAGVVGWFAYDLYQKEKVQDNCPVPVDQIPTNVVPKEQERRVI